MKRVSLLLAVGTLLASSAVWARGPRVCGEEKTLRPLFTEARETLAELRGMAQSHPDFRTRRALTRKADDLKRLLGEIRGALSLPERPRPRPEPPPPPEPQAMDPGDFAALMKALKAESFPKGKLAVLREAARRNRFRVAQLRHVMQEFSFADGKLQAAAAIHPVLVDPQNFYKVYQDLQFESDKLKLRRMIGE